MRMMRWFLLIGLLAGVGVARVTQQTAMDLKGYRIGQQTAEVHKLANDMRRLTAEVIALRSPSHLGQVMTDHDLVARSEVSSAPGVTQLAHARR